MTELEKRRAFGMVCDTCGVDVSDDAFTGIKSMRVPEGHYTLFVYYCDRCAPPSSFDCHGKLPPGF